MARWVLGLAMAWGSAACWADGPVRPVVEFGTSAWSAMADLYATKATVVRASGGRPALRVVFDHRQWAHVMFRPATPWDWTGAGGLAIEIRNPGRDAVDFGVRVDDDASADGAQHCRQGGGTAAPGATRTFVIPLGANPMDVGMRGLPVPSGLVSLGSQGGGGLELKHIVAFQVFMGLPKAGTTLELLGAHIVPWDASLARIVDEFGQYTGANWPGKLRSATELVRRRKTEDAALTRTPRLPGMDRYGGWAVGPHQKATGYFRTEKVDGRWWLVTPEGTLFFSVGVDCVGGSQATVLTGREAMFGALPDRAGPLGRHFGRFDGAHSGPVKAGESFDFVAANAQRKYGERYSDEYVATALRRLPAWGFNTVGNWSDQRVYRNGRLPYVATTHVSGPFATVPSGSDYWGRMPDPFDPVFAQTADSAVAWTAGVVKDDPLCVGYFVDNELSWGGGGDDGRCGLAIGTLLASAASQPAKRALIARLRTTYASIGELNRAWRVSLVDWAALDAPFRVAFPFTEAQTRDLRGFVREFADRYFSVIRTALRRHAPHHLYLGCRFAWATPEAEEAAAAACDVISYNIYAPKVDSGRFAVASAADKPCIIGEFHFGALDRGMFHTGLVAAPDQAGRGRMYQEYVRSVLDNPLFVGCHWFQYGDEPLTGRWFDGENYNIGMVDCTDTPYPELTHAAAEVHAGLYARRSGASGVR